MKLIFAVDAIFPPLTGIGRYAWELATRLPDCAGIDDLRFFSAWRWVGDVRRLLPANQAGHGTADASRFGALRRRMARYPWAVRLYGMLVPVWQARLLKGCGDYLYHSPNYFLPPHDGPAVATVHDLSIYRYPETHPAARVLYFEQEFRRTLDRASWLITDSEAVRREVIDMCGWPAERITAVPLGVDPAFHPRPEEALAPVLASYGLDPGGYALCVSTLEPRKNIGRLLSAYGALPADVRAKWPLIIAGGQGWLDQGLLSQLSQAERQGWVRHLGYVPQSHLPILYAGARATCFPTLYEGFGLPVLESMASGAPVLTSDCSCLPEVAGGAAWLANPLDVDALRDGLIRVLVDEEWRERGRRRGLAMAADAGWDSCVSRLVDVYRSVLD